MKRNDISLQKGGVSKSGRIINHCWFCGKEIGPNSLRCKKCNSIHNSFKKGHPATASCFKKRDNDGNDNHCWLCGKKINKNSLICKNCSSRKTAIRRHEEGKLKRSKKGEKNDNHCWLCGKKIIVFDAIACQSCANKKSTRERHSTSIFGFKKGTHPESEFKKGSTIGINTRWKKGERSSIRTEFTREGRIEQMKQHPELIFKSKWESKFIEIVLIEKLGYNISDIEQQKFVCDHPFDILIKSKMMLIEIDGLWCHKGKGKYDNQEKDKQDNLNAIKHGYTVTRFDDVDLKRLGVI